MNLPQINLERPSLLRLAALTEKDIAVLYGAPADVDTSDLEYDAMGPLWLKMVMRWRNCRRGDADNASRFWMQVDPGNRRKLLSLVGVNSEEVMNFGAYICNGFSGWSLSEYGEEVVSAWRTQPEWTWFFGLSEENQVKVVNQYVQEIARWA